jgi:hypothetical protein
MPIIDIDAILSKVVVPTTSQGVTLARSAMSARSEPEPSRRSEPVSGEDNHNLANLANLAASCPELELVAAQAGRLLTTLAQRGDWAHSDVVDGQAAIDTNPKDALALFTEMLQRLPSSEIDNHVRCVDCLNLSQGKCRRHERAGLTSATVGRDLATIPQHCCAFVDRSSISDIYWEIKVD